MKPGIDIQLKGLYLGANNSSRKIPDGFAGEVENLRPAGLGDWEPIQAPEGYDVEYIGRNPSLIVSGPHDLRLFDDQNTQLTTGTLIYVRCKLELDSEVVFDVTASTQYNRTSWVRWSTNLLSALSTALNNDVDFSELFTASSVSILENTTARFTIEAKQSNASLNGVPIELEVYRLVSSTPVVLDVLHDLHPSFGGALALPTQPPLKIFRQVRRFYGKQTLNYEEELDRFIFVGHDRISILSFKEGRYLQSIRPYVTGFEVHDAELAQLGNTCVISLIGQNGPEKMVSLVDDTFIDYEELLVPDMKIKRIDLNSPPAGTGLTGGRYGIRFAYKLGDGYIGFTPVTVVAYTAGKFALEISRVGFGELPVITELAQGIAILLSERWDDGSTSGIGVLSANSINGVMNSNFFEVGVMAMDQQEPVLIDLDDEQITARPIVEDSYLNSTHVVFGSRLFSYNGRMLVGDTAVRFSKPVNYLPVTRSMDGNTETFWMLAYQTIVFGETPEASSGQRWKYLVEIHTQSGIYYQESDPFVYNFNTPFRPYQGIVQYPDVRAKFMYVLKEVNGQFIRIGTVELKPSRTMNVAFAFVREISSFLSTEFWPDKPASFPSVQRTENRMIVSELDNPYIFRAKNAHVVGSQRETLYAMATNTLPISSGQFGQFPLYVFTDRSIWAFSAVSLDDIVFGAMQPVTSNMGISNPRAVCNVGRAIYFGNSRGIYKIGTDGIEGIDATINDGYRPGDFSYFAYNEFEEHGELWIAEPDYVMVYHLESSMWYKAKIQRLQLTEGVGNTLYGLGADGRLYKENGPAHAHWKFVTRGIDFEAPDRRKRIKRVVVRSDSDFVRLKVHARLFPGAGFRQIAQSDTGAVSITTGSAYEYVISVEGIQNTRVEGITLYVDPRAGARG